MSREPLINTEGVAKESAALHALALFELQPVVLLASRLLHLRSDLSRVFVFLFLWGSKNHTFLFYLYWPAEEHSLITVNVSKSRQQQELKWSCVAWRRLK